MKTIILASRLALTTLTVNGQRQALFVTSAASSTSDLQVSNRLVLLGFNVTRVIDTASQASDATLRTLDTKSEIRMRLDLISASTEDTASTRAQNLASTVSAQMSPRRPRRRRQTRDEWFPARERSGNVRRR